MSPAADASALHFASAPSSPLAYVVPVSGAPLDPDAMLAQAATSLARFKLPRRIEVVDALPHTVTGKVMKWRLRPARSADASS